MRDFCSAVGRGAEWRGEFLEAFSVDSDAFMDSFTAYLIGLPSLDSRTLTPCLNPVFSSTGGVFLVRRSPRDVIEFLVLLVGAVGAVAAAYVAYVAYKQRRGETAGSLESDLPARHKNRIVREQSPRVTVRGDKALSGSGSWRH